MAEISCSLGAYMVGQVNGRIDMTAIATRFLILGAGFPRVNLSDKDIAAVGTCFTQATVKLRIDPRHPSFH